jgi:lysozyme
MPESDNGSDSRAKNTGDDLVRLLTRHEGRRAFAYTDTVGRLTIGVGRNLTDRGLADDEIDLLLANDIALARSICEDQFGDAFSDASPAWWHALVSMAFNLGGPRLAGFTRLRAAVRRGDWQAAAVEALDSRWATQTGHRATEIAAMLRGTSG